MGLRTGRDRLGHFAIYIYIYRMSLGIEGKRQMGGKGWLGNINFKEAFRSSRNKKSLVGLSADPIRCRSNAIQKMQPPYIKINLYMPIPSISVFLGAQASGQQQQTIQNVLDVIVIPDLSARQNKRARPRSNSATPLLALEDRPSSSNVPTELKERIMVDVSNLEDSFSAMQKMTLEYEAHFHSGM